ncbi:MAG: SDR family NAD(P)-dependent oxidoreductase [Pseudomonadales bacterium]
MKTIIVTGANKGIGLAIVEAILQEEPDHQVLLGSRNTARGSKARDTLLQKNPGWSERVQILEIDVCNENSVAQAAVEMASMTEKNGDELVAMVNNAGIARGSLADIVEVNSYGMMRATEHLAPLICDGGRVVNVTSASGPNYVAECAPQWQEYFKNAQLDWPQADKFMQECFALSNAELSAKGLPAGSDYGFSKACANLCNMILARGHSNLLINACTPGYIETDLTRGAAGSSAKTAEQLGMKQPKDGARVVMHLLFSEMNESGHYFGSDALRSPLDRYRSPGSAAYTGD